VTAAGRFSVCVTVDAAGHLVGRFLRQAAGQGGSVAQAGLPLKNSLNILIGGRLLKLCTVHTVSEGVNYSDHECYHEQNVHCLPHWHSLTSHSSISPRPQCRKYLRPAGSGKTGST